MLGRAVGGRWHETDALYSQNDSCFDGEDLPVKSTDFFSGALFTSLPNSPNKVEVVRENIVGILYYFSRNPNLLF